MFTPVEFEKSTTKFSIYSVVWIFVSNIETVLKHFYIVRALIRHISIFFFYILNSRYRH